ncbi:hypothetical protein C0068_19370 [Zhongshania marina]|uniref:Uncharacterized protein n=2 Tax=Zhongshania marina TaxID=2304603 RepID=A0A2S4HAI5_9GAMM|nr:hypothetical protein C0068_19370 [Marortus luteolus]
MEWSAIITHMRNEHEIAPQAGYDEYLKEKLCRKCNNVKPLDAYARAKGVKSCFLPWYTSLAQLSQSGGCLARPMRLEFAGALYHVTSAMLRKNRQEAIIKAVISRG